MKEEIKIQLTNDGPSKSGIFHTIQGEGRFAGYPSVFTRLSRCNLRCQWVNPDGTVTQCDTPYSSFEPENNTRDLESIVEEIKSYQCEHIVISGGEPFFQKNLVPLVQELIIAKHWVTIETNGTIYRELPRECFLSFSPKLSSSCGPVGNPHYSMQSKQRYKPDVLAKFIIAKHDFQLKYVVNTQEDIQEILEARDELAKLIFDKAIHDFDEVKSFLDKHIWLMPQGVTNEQFNAKADWIIQECQKNKWKFCDRIHVRIWGHKRGV
jgi:7-carboxy-7-deazaguanine synthase